MNITRIILQKLRLAGPVLLAVVALAGCATTDSTYSSLPPTPQYPDDRPELDRRTVTSPGPVLESRPVAHLPPDQYTDLLDRIRDGYRLDTHDGPVCDDVLALYRRVIARVGPIPTLVEWDAEVPTWERLAAEAELVRGVREEAVRHGA